MPEFRVLVDGYRRFKSDAYVKQKARYDALASDGQSPPIMIISCSDSRVDPATVFDTTPGQVFALRNVASLVPPYETGGGLHGVSAAIEFGVLGLEVRHIVVLGHAQCGGIKASLEGANLGHDGHSFIDGWVDIIRPARDRIVASASDDPQRDLELDAVRVSLANLRSFPFIAEREKNEQLKLHGAYFGIADGNLYVLDEQTDIFEVQ
ncbi:carbonic anhydrase [Sphingorhabdus sp.]|uniref:carbonic anhydrase n=1 Tax=Sphingorhabdus sp. TaxID=1902408 RepID=UPI0039832D4A